MVFQFKVYFKVDRLLTGLTAQQKGTTARWYSNKTSLNTFTIQVFANNLTFIQNIPVKSLLEGRQTSNWYNAQQKGTTAQWYSNKTSLGAC